MSGWALFRPHQVVTADGHPFLDRLKFVQTPWFGVYVHLIHAPDPDPDPHDHPWTFLSVTLSGQYVEMVWPDSSNGRYCLERVHRRGRPHLLTRREAHRITQVHGLVWTLCIVGRNHGSWRFWTPWGPVAWDEYLASRQSPSEPLLRERRAPGACPKRDPHPAHGWSFTGRAGHQRMCPGVRPPMGPIAEMFLP